MQYDYTDTDADGALLQSEIAATGLPVSHVNTSPDELLVSVHTTRNLDATEKATLDGVVAAHVPPTSDQRRRDAGIDFYNSDESPEALVERSGQEALLKLVNELQKALGINETGMAQLRNSTRAIIKPGA